MTTRNGSANGGGAGGGGVPGGCRTHRARGGTTQPRRDRAWAFGAEGCAFALSGVFSTAMSALGFIILALVLIVILVLVVVFVRRRRRGGGVIASRAKE
jgi:hypothetical protein